MIFIGIDPGLTGAIAALRQDGGIAGLWDAPILTVKKNKATRHELNIADMVEILKTLPALHDAQALVAAVERVSSMPGQGVASSFSFGKGFGIWLGILSALGIPYDLVHPVRWKKLMLDGMGKDKDASRIRAKELFGSQVDLSLKKHHGRADALLIAEWRRRQG